MRHARGLTLVELMTVIAVAAVLAMVALPSFSKIMATQRLKSAATNLQMALLLARSEGLKRSGNVTLSSVSGNADWSQGWRVSDGTSGAVIGNYPGFSSLSVSGPAAGVTYQSSGRVTASVATVFKVSSSTISDVRCVNITVMGVPSVTTSGC